MANPSRAMVDTGGYLSSSDEQGLHSSSSSAGPHPSPHKKAKKTNTDTQKKQKKQTTPTHKAADVSGGGGKRPSPTSTRGGKRNATHSFSRYSSAFPKQDSNTERLIHHLRDLQLPRTQSRRDLWYVE
jgi:hypothetical protein